MKRDYGGGTHVVMNIGLYLDGCDYRAEGSGVYYCAWGADPSDFACSKVGGTGPASDMVDTWKVDPWDSASNTFRWGSVQLAQASATDFYVVTMRASHATVYEDQYDPCLTFTKGAEWNLDLYASQSADAGTTWSEWMQLTDTIYYPGSPTMEMDPNYMADE